jgi:hypothetical protein
VQAKFTIEDLVDVSNPFDGSLGALGVWPLEAKPSPGPVIYGLYEVHASFDIEDIYFAKNSVGYAWACNQGPHPGEGTSNTFSYQQELMIETATIVYHLPLSDRLYKRCLGFVSSSAF